MKSATWTCSNCRADVADYLKICTGCGAYREDVGPSRPAPQPLVRLDSESNRVARHHMVVGGCWLAGGGFVTLLSYQSAAPGETYVAATGAILYGLIRFLVGTANYRR